MSADIHFLLFYMLVAGACAYSTPARGGALTFSVDSPPSDTWADGSAFIYIMLVAGASTADTPAKGGALSFLVYYSPSGAWWFVGSANKYFKYKNKKTEYTILGILR